ncbi:MAG: hypothetical protein ACYTFY_05275 [Planctomycetota bacterium]|jgi:phosphoribosylaminoimidazolecarboxamide formyltransferase/IMP cyclohydrolase
MPITDKRWAYLSVKNYNGLADLASGLIKAGYSIIATPGTSTFLKSNNIEITEIEEITGFPFILEGMVKSFHPTIMAGIQVSRKNKEALEECRKNNIPIIDIVVMNFAGYETADGKLNTGTPLHIAPMALMKCAAVNYDEVLVVTRPEDYPEALQEINSNEKNTDFRFQMAQEAWNCAFHYDLLLTYEHDRESGSILPPVLRGEYKLNQRLKYGENPHQQSALYMRARRPGPSVASARQLLGGELSYNNVIDADAGLSLALEFAAPGAAVIKHAMPISAAIGANIADAATKAFDAEWASRIGAAIALNGVVDEKTAQAIIQPGRSIDLVIAADFTEEAINLFKDEQTTAKEIILLKAGDMNYPAGTHKTRRVSLHHVTGGVLAQTMDDGVYGPGGFHVVTKREPTDEEMINLEFACLVAKHTRSHSSVLAKNGATVAVATVQTGRMEAANIALNRAGQKVPGSVVAADGIIRIAELALLAESGVTAVIHTGGTPEEEQLLVQACDQQDIAMIITKMRHFSHI